MEREYFQQQAGRKYLNRNGVVYPSDFPLYVALQYRNDELQRMEIVKADLETAEPDDPF